MQFVFDDGARAHDVDVVVHDPDAVVADLANALAGADGTDKRLVVDGHELPGGRRLDRAGITGGATVRLEPSDAVPGPGGADDCPVAATAPDGPVVIVEVVGGLDAGRRTRVAPGSWSIGRIGADLTVDDLAMSAVHARVDVATDGTVTLTDRHSLNGTWVADVALEGPTVVSPDAIVRLGASHLQVGPPVGEDRPVLIEPGRRFATGATLPFNRRPRLMPSSRREPLDPPRAPAEAMTTSTIGVVGVLAPLLLGLVMVRVLHNWAYGMFGLLSPVMLVANAIESKRRDRRSTRREHARYVRDLSDFRTKLADLAASERRLRLERLPAPSEILHRTAAPSSRLWERRPHHDDFLRLRAGLGSVPWEPPVEGLRRGFDNEVRRAITQASRLPATPVEVDLSSGGVAGVFGPRAASLAIARSLVAQAVTLHGPADLAVVVLTAEGRSNDWDWTKWLPHNVDRSGSEQRMLAAGREAADQLLRNLVERAAKQPADISSRHHDMSADGPTVLLVLDDESLTEGRRSPARSVLRGLAGPVAGIVLADSEDRLPAVCTTVIEVTGEHGAAVVHRPATGDQIGDVLLSGMADRAVRTVARGLARFEDPELDGTGTGLPAEVGLLPMLGLDPPTVESILQRWEAGGPDPDLVTPIGVAKDGVLALDLVRDGPHGLVAGTTGSGKSELLRSLVAGLAAGCSTDHLTFVLIDFKGGSAFDQCARLPHTVGMVTDLDEHLGARALRCLEAELRHRERRLRDAGVGDLKEYRRLPGDHAPLPRLVVVIDEFATLKRELPDFIDALIGVAQRGRSLGVHLVLSTQRPSGAVSENIRANTNLRIALRVHDTSDSLDVIELPDAASIGRHQPGRALARLGPGEVVAIQTALSTGTPVTGGRPPVEVRQFLFGTAPSLFRSTSPDRRPTRVSTNHGGPGPTDLSLLVDAICQAFGQTGHAAPRRPWPEPLGARIDLDSLADDRPPQRFGAPGAMVCFALGDLPDQQIQQPMGWIPADGNLLLVGVGGSGTTTALSSIALTVARTTGPDDLHIYVLDAGAGELGPLGRLPHTGAVITADEPERQIRLVRHLKTELSRRRALPDARSTEARILVLLDGLAGFRAVWDEADLVTMFDDVVRVFGDGPELGVHLAISADRPSALPTALSGLARQRLIFRLGDRLDYGIFGLSTRDVPDLSPGGALVGESGTEVRIGLPTPDLEAAVSLVAETMHVATRRPPAAMSELPTHVDPLDLVPAARLGAPPWFIPVGIGDAALEPVGLTLYGGEHSLIAGPARSGRTTALQTIVCVVRATQVELTVVAIADPRSPLSTMSVLDRVLPPDCDRTSLDALGDLNGPVLVLIDDADLVADEHGCIQSLIDRRRTDLHIVAAGRAEALRQHYVHWTRAVRASRSGILLQPDPDLDGDLFGTRLPRRAPVRLGVGRGYLVTGGHREPLQVAGGAGGLSMD